MSFKDDSVPVHISLLITISLLKDQSLRCINRALNKATFSNKKLEMKSIQVGSIDENERETEKLFG